MREVVVPRANEPNNIMFTFPPPNTPLTPNPPLEDEEPNRVRKEVVINNGAPAKLIQEKGEVMRSNTFPILPSLIPSLSFGLSNTF